MKRKTGMISRRDDGGACWKRWYKTRKAHLLAMSGKPPDNLCMDQVKLTVDCRFAELLLNNPRVTRYIGKYHPSELQTLQSLSAEFKDICETDGFERDDGVRTPIRVSQKHRS